MWSGRDRDRDRDRDRESERESQRRREEGHGRGLTSDGLRRETGLWMVFFLGAAAIGNVFALRRRLLNIEQQSAQQGNGSWRRGNYGSSAQGERWSQRMGGSQTHHQEERSAQQAQRQWQAQVDEQQRRERIRRVKEAFAREKVHANTHNTWQERYGDKWDWRWEGDRWEWKGEEQRQRAQREQDWRRNEERKQHVSGYELLKQARLAHHFNVLGLDATRSQPYSDADIKAAFRSKALEYHPDQNQGNKQLAEVKFKQLLESYHLLKGQLKVR